MKNKMTELKIAYFDQLGRKELDQAVQHFVLKHPNVDVKLLATSHDGAFAKLNEDEADIAINDLRDENLNFDETELTQAGVMAILPKEMYPNGIQMIEKDELNDMTCFIVARLVSYIYLKICIKLAVNSSLLTRLKKQHCWSPLGLAILF